MTTPTTSPSRGLVLVLPGGKPQSWARSRHYQLSNVRMRSITARLRHELGRSYTVHQVRYRFRGWNAPDTPAVADVLRTIDAHPQRPIVLVGHSMGGRVAAHVSSRVDVAGVVALAPWWPENDGAMIRSPHLVTIHGTEDRWTSADESFDQTRALAENGTAARFYAMAGAGHFMLNDVRRWHDLTAQAVAEVFASGQTQRI